MPSLFNNVCWEDLEFLLDTYLQKDLNSIPITEVILFKAKHSHSSSYFRSSGLSQMDCDSSRVVPSIGRLLKKSGWAMEHLWNENLPIKSSWWKVFFIFLSNIPWTSVMVSALSWCRLEMKQGIPWNAFSVPWSKAVSQGCKWPLISTVSLGQFPD